MNPKANLLSRWLDGFWDSMIFIEPLVGPRIKIPRSYLNREIRQGRTGQISGEQKGKVFYAPLGVRGEPFERRHSYREYPAERVG